MPENDLDRLERTSYSRSILDIIRFAPPGHSLSQPWGLMKTYTLLVLVGVLTFNLGCSSLVAVSGKDVSAYASMEQVRKDFGKPLNKGMADGRDYEEFTSHTKISDPQRAGVLIMGDLMTCGLLELFLFPYELCCVGHNVVAGETVRFAYDAQGSVTDVYVDGEQVSLRANAGRTIEGAK
ncbi:hypothetical protein BH10PLA2_BH10PLA2_21040 [soil metagenome]